MGFLNIEGELVTELGPVTGKPTASGVTANVSQFVVVRRTGGPARARVLDGPLFVVEAYAKFENDAIDLLNPIRVHLLALRKLGPAHVKSCTEVGGPANLPDPRLPLYARYTSTFEMVLRAP
jgi:hypothetical protein